MRRILLGAFGEVFGQAIRLLLDQVPTTFVVTSAVWVTLPLLEDVRPDVLVVDLDNETILSRASNLSGRFPEMAVIACSAEEPFMMVFPPFHGGESYSSVLTPDSFAAVVVDPRCAPASFAGLGGPDVTGFKDSSAALPGASFPISWNPVVLAAVELRQAAKLARARSRWTRRQTAELWRETRQVQMALGLRRDGGRPSTG